MSAGPLSRRVDLISAVRVEDGAGGFARAIDTIVATVWADVRTATPREISAAGRLEQRMSHVVKIRARPDLTIEQGMRARFTDKAGRRRELYVETVADDGENGRFYVLACQEGRMSDPSTPAAPSSPPSVPNAAEIVMTIPAGVGGSSIVALFTTVDPLALAAARTTATATAAATAVATFALLRNGGEIGALAFAAGATVGSISITSAELAIGDQIAIRAPASADATLGVVTLELAADDRTEATPIATPRPALSNPSEFAVSITGRLEPDESIDLTVAARPMRIVAAASRAVARIAPANAAVLRIARNGVQVGAVTFAAGATVGRVVTTSPAISTGDRVSIIAPAVADPTLADIAVTLTADDT